MHAPKLGLIPGLPKGPLSLPREISECGAGSNPWHSAVNFAHLAWSKFRRALGGPPPWLLASESCRVSSSEQLKEEILDCLHCQRTTPKCVPLKLCFGEFGLGLKGTEAGPKAARSQSTGSGVFYLLTVWSESVLQSETYCLPPSGQVRGPLRPERLVLETRFISCSFFSHGI